MSGYNSRKLNHKLNCNLNNRGFSLVEILIAVAILVLCAVPLLKAFVTSAQTNARARQNLNATTLAENIMEEIKAAGVEDYGVKSGDTVTIDGVDLPVYEAEYSNYSFDGRAYDVKAVMTPSQETYLDGTDEKAYNAQGIPEISVMDDSRDAVYVEDKNARFDIIDENADSLGMKAEELLNACRTEYRFAVKENHGSYTVTQTVTYKDASGNIIGTPQTLTIFDSVLTGADLRSLYVCYIPALRTAGDMYRTQETVVIENRQDIPVDVYLIRQGSQDTPLAVSIIESAPSTVAATQIHTNLSVDDNTDIGSIERNGSSITAATAKSAFGFQKMGEAAKADAARLYTVEVTVKPVDSEKSITLTGTAMK